MLSKKTAIYYFGFFLISIIALWQIVFYVHPVKYDMIDCYFPWRFFISECFHTGQFPYWNPYQDLGYPIHADPSSGVWYPFVWLIGSTVGYNIYTIGLEYWVHISIAAIGFYKLCKTLKMNDEASFIAAICYMLCGVFIGNAQHLTYVVSACWIPFILNYYIKFAENTDYFSAIKTALFISLLLTGGYPAFTITLLYLLVMLFLFFGGRILLQEKNKKRLFKFLSGNFLMLPLTFLIAGGMLLSIYEVTPYLSRTNSFSIERSLFGPFSPQSSISFILPFAAINSMDFYDTDLSMSNGYFGIIAFVFFIAGLFLKKTPVIKLLFVFSIFALLAAFGKYLPVRKLLYDYAPLMNLFRFPSTFRLFVIIGFLLVAAFAFNSFFDNQYEVVRKRIRLIIFILLPTLLITIFVCRIYGYLSIGDFMRNELFIFSRNSHFTQHIAFNAMVQIGFLAALLVMLMKIRETKKLFLLIVLIVSSDVIISTQLNAPYTVFSQELSAKTTNDHLKKFPKGFPPLPDKAIAETNPHEIYFVPYWKNVNIFQKQISADGFNSFTLTGHEYFRDETPQLYDNIIKNKIIFLSDEIHNENETDKLKQDSSFTSKTLIFDTDEFTAIKNNPLKTDSTDKVTLKKFSPNKFIADTQTKNTQILSLLQSNYKGWKAYINGIEVPIFTSNKSLISIVLPQGNHTVTFEYNNPKIKLAFIISITTILLTLGLILFKNRILNLWQYRKK